MDKIDVLLCQSLLLNSRQSYRELADKLGLSVNAIHKRIQSLIEMGIIRGFTAKISLMSLGATSVLIFGSTAEPIPSEEKCAQGSRSTYWKAFGGVNYAYIGGYLKGLEELDGYVSKIRKEMKMPEPSVGILGSFASIGRPKRQLSDLDYGIVQSLRDYSRKNVSDISDELGVSVKTVRRHLNGMIDDQSIELSIKWYPDASDDIISFMHVYIGPDADKIRVANMIMRKFHPNLLFYYNFLNIPNMILCMTWNNHMKAVKELHEAIENEEGVVSASPNIIYAGTIFETWRDSLLEQKASSRSKKESQTSS